MRSPTRFFLVIAFLLVLFLALRNIPSTPQTTIDHIPTSALQPTTSTTTFPQDNTPATTVVAERLDTPWAIAFLPDGSFLVTERAGRVRRISSSGQLDQNPAATLQKVKEIGEGGLLGIAVHPNFVSNHFVYLYYTYSGDGSNTQNRVVRMTDTNNQLTSEQVIVDNIPGASNHNGGRIKFGPDGFLYIGTGDAENPSQSQDQNSLAGKILRVTDEGKPAAGNPFGNLVYSYGHRNVQGLAWDANGQLWATEHGPSGGSLGTGNDEVNLIQSGKNYGWPVIQGDQTRAGMETPKKNSGKNTAWAPSGASFVGASLYFAGLRGQTLYETITTNNQVTGFNEHLKSQFGRLREVVVGPDGMLYITTSNKDGRGSPSVSDDRVLKINPAKL